MSNEEHYTKEEVEKWIDEIGTKLWDVDMAMSKGIETDKKIFFHPGIMRNADEHREEVWFIDDNILKSNVAYELMILDFYDWFLSRFGIDGLARQLLIKNAIAIYGNIMDAILVYIAKRWHKEGQHNNGCNNSRLGIKKAASLLVKHNIISKDLKKALIKDVWSIRNKQHIGSLPDRELNWYSDDNYEKTKAIWGELKQELSEAKRNDLF